mmetsp:Transcript_8768/g.22332  ORF Transcript_8768/g.22332 Transcript_8768/m.22332 type:complete len:222 (-) Transcript_8768:1291-1956(-)
MLGQQAGGGTGSSSFVWTTRYAPSQQSTSARTHAPGKSSSRAPARPSSTLTLAKREGRCACTSRAGHCGTCSKQPLPVNSATSPAKRMPGAGGKCAGRSKEQCAESTFGDGGKRADGSSGERARRTCARRVCKHTARSVHSTEEPSRSGAAPPAPPLCCWSSAGPSCADTPGDTRRSAPISGSTHSTCARTRWPTICASSSTCFAENSAARAPNAASVRAA